MRRMIACALVALAACKGGGSTNPANPANPANPTAAVTLNTDQDRTLYALGLIMGRRMEVFHLNAAELAIVQRGIADQVTGARPQVELDTWGPRVNDMARARANANGNNPLGGANPPGPNAQEIQAERERGRAFAERAAAEPGARRTASGLVFRELSPGTGPQPTAASTVRVNYRGKLIDGTEFDSSRGNPVEFPLSGVVPCWTEGVQLMHVGSRARLVCPADIAYGERRAGRIPPGATLDFEVELVGIVGGGPEGAAGDGGAAR